MYICALLPISSFIFSVRYNSRSYQLNEMARGPVPLMMAARTLWVDSQKVCV